MASTGASYGSSRNYISEQELSECDRQEIHKIGAIQGNSGHLLFWKHPSNEIIAYDEKVRDVEFIKHVTNLDIAPMGTRINEWMPMDLLEETERMVEEMEQALSTRSFHFYTFNNRSYSISVSTTTSDLSVLSMEIEETPADQASAKVATTLLHLGRIVEFYAHERLMRTACNTVFDLLEHYDRGMVYRFNDDLSGQVIHEVKKPNVETSYLGLRFPASDIPLPARELYIKNGIRYIHDLEEDNVPIVSAGNHEVDLTQIRMRACAKPHVIYLRNMGVVSSLSIAIVADNELWGLFAFHGYTRPYQPPLSLRIACETISAMLSVRIEALMRKHQSTRIMALGESMISFKQDKSVIHNLYDFGEEGILRVLDADILVAHVHDAKEDEADSIVLGDQKLNPSRTFWEKLKTYPNRELCIVSDRKGIAAMGMTEQECPPAGIIYFREGKTQIVIGRATRASDVVWAGNPDEPKLKIGGILSPRNSFEQFMEKARVESRAWSTEDINVASVFRDNICELSHNYMMRMLRNDIEDANRRYVSAMERARDNYEFFAHMSHELRTPFHGVMGCLDMLQQNGEAMSAEEVQNIVTTAISSGNHMVNLLNDILDISKNKHLSSATAHEGIPFTTLAVDCVECSKSLATKRSVKLNTDVDPFDDKIVLVTDRTKIIQIVSNIVNNAIKFTKEGKIDVLFRLHTKMQNVIDEWTAATCHHSGHAFTMKPGELFESLAVARERVRIIPTMPSQRWLSVSIEDTGCGMKPEELVEMLKPYTQSSDESNKVVQGTGLGLFICVSLCHQLSGFLACASTPGKGTAFHIGIPVDLDDSKPDAKPKAVEKMEEPSEGRIPIRGPIMLVDDNKVNVKILCRQLELELQKVGLESVELVVATGGAEAVETYIDREPSLCIIDYHMPDIDGVDATKAIRQYEYERGLAPSYIFSYTADATEEAEALLRECGVNAIMAKPPPTGFVQDLVRRLDVAKKS